MHRYIEKRAEKVKEKIEEDINSNLNMIEDCFSHFLNGKERKFIEYYNSTVLKGGKINFREFSKQWVLRLSKDFYADFENDYEKRIDEIRNKRDIIDFYISYCIPKEGRTQHSFCSKLFHTIIPDKFPPVDSKLRKEFGLINENYLLSILIIKKAYKDYIRDNKDKIEKIREKLFRQKKFGILQINEISSIRIIDMFYRHCVQPKSRKR
jgi:hypothetical protein